MCAVLLRQKDGYHYLQSELLNQYGIRHFFSTIKHDGLERPVNFGFHYGETREEILSHYIFGGEILGEPVEGIVNSTQIHEAIVRDVEEADCGKGILRESDIENADGLICGENHIPLVIFSADCTPVLRADKKNRAVCAVHAGWRGTVQKIAKNAVEKMYREYGIPKEDILCAIGPCISKCCFEVSAEVAEEFEKLFPMESFAKKKENGKYHIDLKGVNREILLREGVPEKNMDVSNDCTFCREELFYSFRRQGKEAGRMAAFIVR